MSTVQSNENVVPSTSKSMPEPSNATSNSEASSNVVSPWQVFPPPTLIKSTNARGRKPTKARLLTDNSFKNELIEVQQRKDAAQLKKEAAALKKAAKMVNNARSATISEKSVVKSRGRKKNAPDSVDAVVSPNSVVVKNRGSKRKAAVSIGRQQDVQVKQPRMKRPPKTPAKKQKLLQVEISSDDSSAEEYVQSDDSSEYNESDTPLVSDKCLYCQQTYESDISPNKWISCLLCNMWTHEKCTNMGQEFVCEHCRLF